MLIHDLLGEPLYVGDTIAYATSRNRRGAMHVGVITNVKMHRGFLQAVIEEHSASNGEVSESPVLLKNYERIVKL